RTPDGASVWCHFSHVVADGYRQLSVGDRVRFDYETPGQDGCDGRVLTAAQLLDDDGSVPSASELPAAQDMTGAYASKLTIVFDDDAGPPPGNRE
ncbi:MAG: cold shock domain-containing protein, partial [Actinobacteria bacterium]|nr:cold shock domain-containing protein [Actinomycetota bacterium]